MVACRLMSMMFSCQPFAVNQCGVVVWQLQQKSDDMVVLDCHLSTEQSACHVNYKHLQQWIEIPEETITSGYGLQNKYKHTTRTQHTIV